MAAPRGPRLAVLRRCLQRLAITGLAAWAALSMQGCLPPDWSFCDCDFRDNFWNHVLNDVHMLFDGPDFVRKARDNTTFQGKYLQGPLPHGYDCPLIADSFWKGWPRFGLTRGLIEGSMGDLWMPAARDRFKQICMAGHLALITICSQHFLVKAARAIDANEPDHMRWMEAAYSHMVAIRNLGQDFRLRQCMPQQGFSLKVWSLLKWSEKWVGKESQGTQPVAAYMGGALDPYQMLFTEAMQHTERSRHEALPDRRPCVPFKNPQCWKRHSKLLLETCEYCCSPFLHKTGRGNPWCFDSVWTYERCCQTDYQDLVCDLKRKGEEGGCVDCKKSVAYVCLTPPEKRLQDAQDNYNKQVDKYNNFQSESNKLAKAIQEARLDLEKKHNIYQRDYQDFDTKLRVWSVAHNNESRLLSQGRLGQQQLTRNNSAKALAEAKAAHQRAQAAAHNATSALKAAHDAKARGQESVNRNVTAHDAARAALADSRERLVAAHAARHAAQAVAAEGAAEAARRAAEEEARRGEAATVDRHLASVLAASTAQLDEAVSAMHVAERAEGGAHMEDVKAAAAAEQARIANASAQNALDTSAKHVAQVEKQQTEAERTLAKAEELVNQTAVRLREAETDLQGIRDVEATVHGALLNRTSNGSAVRCLVEHTPANMSAKPKVAAACSATDDSKGLVTKDSPPVGEDQNEFCKSWAKEGECERNPAFMKRTCASSCAPRPILTSACPEPSVPGVPLGDVIPDLLALAASLLARGGDSYSESNLSKVPEAFRDQVSAAATNLKRAREHERVAASNVTNAEKTLASAEQALQSAVKLEKSAREAHADAEADLASVTTEKQTWEGMVRSNETALTKATSALDGKRDDHRRLVAAAEQAATLAGSLEAAARLASQTAAKRLGAVGRAARRLEVLDEHIRTLNDSMSENLTTAVATWLEDKEEHESTGSDGGWGLRLLKAAKQALVSMVSSVEVFLETYVVSLTDKESVIELVRAVDDRKAAKSQLKEAESAARAAEEQVEDAKKSAEKAEASQKSAEVIAEKAAGVVANAEDDVILAKDALQQSKAGLAEATKLWEAAKGVLAEKTTKLQAATQGVSDATAAVEKGKQRLTRSREILETAKAEVVEATSAVADANGALEAAVVGAVHMYLAELQDSCKAAEADFELYLQQRELLSLVRALVMQRVRSHAAVDAWHASAALNRTAADAAAGAARDASADAREAHGKRASEAEAAKEELRTRLVYRNATAAQLMQARSSLAAARDLAANISAPREAARGAAREAHAEAAEAGRRAAVASKASEAKRFDLLAARNRTNSSLRAMEAAEKRTLEARRALELARAWLQEYVPSLYIDYKQNVLDEAQAEVRRRNATEESATVWERRMRSLLGTHQRHLALLNTQVDLDTKNGARAAAKELFSASEKATVDAQAKLDKLLKEEKTCHENIGKTYEALQKLLKEHEQATEAYNKQDPEERKRSFSTKLEGSGADPGPDGNF